MPAIGWNGSPFGERAVTLRMFAEVRRSVEGTHSPRTDSEHRDDAREMCVSARVCAEVAHRRIRLSIEGLVHYGVSVRKPSREAGYAARSRWWESAIRSESNALSVRPPLRESLAAISRAPRARDAHPSPEGPLRKCAICDARGRVPGPLTDPSAMASGGEHRHCCRRQFKYAADNYYTRELTGCAAALLPRFARRGLSSSARVVVWPRDGVVMVCHGVSWCVTVCHGVASRWRDGARGRSSSPALSPDDGALAVAAGGSLLVREARARRERETRLARARGAWTRVLLVRAVARPLCASASAPADRPSRARAAKQALLDRSPATPASARGRRARARALPRVSARARARTLFRAHPIVASCAVVCACRVARRRRRLRSGAFLPAPQARLAREARLWARDGSTRRASGGRARAVLARAAHRGARRGQ